MTSTNRKIALRELLEAYLESRRPQVHPVMTDHVQKTLLAFEAALGVGVPRSPNDVPPETRVMYLLFVATTESLLSFRTPLSGALEAGLLFHKLESAGEGGDAVLRSLKTTAEAARMLRESQFAILLELLRMFLNGASPSATMDEVRATGLYPGDSPENFNIYDHM